MGNHRLNIFQRLFLQWDSIHPYNAAQIMRLEGSCRPELMQRTWHEALAAMGLGRVVRKGGSFRYKSLNGQTADYPIRILERGVSLENHVSWQLNQAFDDAELPFRPFVLIEDGSFYAGIIYHHWVADSISIRLLMEEWFLRTFDPAQIPSQSAQPARGGYWSHFGPHKTEWRFPGSILDAARLSSRMRRVRRVEGPAAADFRVRFEIHKFPDGWLQTQYEATRKLDIRLNDLFLAALAMTCNRFVPVVRRPNRQDIALGSIVDLRQSFQGEMSRDFGLFLGFSNVICRPEHLQNPGQLVRAIATQSDLQKKTGIAQLSMLRMLAGVLAGQIMSPGNLLRFYRKRLPLAGGISNVNLNKTWIARYHPQPLMEYIRVSPTGPLMPLVLATTTLGQSFHVGLTYRTSLIDPAVTGETMSMFLNSAQLICQTTRQF